MFKTKKNLNSLEHIIGSVDKTNPIHFKEKNEFFFRNADTIITSVHKNNNNNFITLLGTRFPSKDIISTFDSKKERFLIEQKIKKVLPKSSCNSKILSQEKELKNFGGKELFQEFEHQNNINDQDEILNKFRSTYTSKFLNGTISEFNSTKMSFFNNKEKAKSKLFVDKLSKKKMNNNNLNLKLKQNKGISTMSYTINEKNLIEVPKLMKISKSNSKIDFHNQSIRYMSSNKKPTINVMKKSKSHNLLDLNRENLTSKKGVSPKNDLFFTQTKFKTNQINSKIKEKLKNKTIIKKEFIKSIKISNMKKKDSNNENNKENFITPKKFSKRNNEIKSLITNLEPENTIQPKNNKFYSNLKKNNKSIHLSLNDRFSKSMSHLEFSNNFKSIWKIDHKVDYTKSAFSSIWLKKLKKDSKSQTDKIKRLNDFDRKLSIKMKKEEEFKKNPKNKFSLRQLICPGKTKIEKAYDFYELNDKNKEIIKSMSKDIYGFEQDDINRLIKEIKYSTLNSSKRTFNFEEYFKKKYPNLSYNQNSKVIAGTHILDVPNHFPKNYMDNIDYKTDRAIYNNLIRDFLDINKTSNIDRNLFYECLSKKKTKSIEKKSIKNYQTFNKTCDYMNNESKMIKNDLISNRSILRTNSLYLDPTWCVFIKTNNHNMNLKND